MASATPVGGKLSNKEESKQTGYIPEGFHTITPYLIVAGAAQFIEFLKAAFGGIERGRVPAPGGKIMHAEVAVGDSMIELADANEQYPPAPTAIHLYVPDADSTYQRAIQAGATLLREIADQPYGDREGSVKDKFGNHWYIATPRGWTPSQALRAVQPYLHLHGAEKMIPFLRDAFGAEVEGGVAKSPEGAVLHATIRIGDTTLELGEAHAEFQPMPCHLHLYVPDTDAMYQRALQAGAASISGPENKPYGERGAGVRDPFGNSWFIATYGTGAKT